MIFSDVLWPDIFLYTQIVFGARRQFVEYTYCLQIIHLCLSNKYTSVTVIRDIYKTFSLLLVRLQKLYRRFVKHRSIIVIVI